MLYTIAALALIGLGGCSSKPKGGITPEMRAEAAELFPGGNASQPQPQTSSKPAATAAKRTDGKHAKPSAGPASGTADSGWSIALEFVAGTGHERAAAQRRLALVQELGRQDIVVRSRADGSVLVLGSYAGIEDARAKTDLDWVRSVQRGDAHPFARAYLLPPVIKGDEGGSHPEWNLAKVRSIPASAGKELTLQVAVFDGAGSLERARLDAEAFAGELRGQGEEAYYFHGPTLSVVTVGLFDASEADSTGRPASKASREAQRAHPRNLRNGHDPILDARGQAQESALMRIP